MSKVIEWCVFYAYGGIDNCDFNMSIQRHATAEGAAELAATEYGDDTKRWVVPKDLVRLFEMEREWKPETYKVVCESSVG